MLLRFFSSGVGRLCRRRPSLPLDDPFVSSSFFFFSLPSPLLFSAGQADAGGQASGGPGEPAAKARRLRCPGESARGGADKAARAKSGSGSGSGSSGARRGDSGRRDFRLGLRLRLLLLPSLTTTAAAPRQQQQQPASQHLGGREGQGPRRRDPRAPRRGGGGLGGGGGPSLSLLLLRSAAALSAAPHPHRGRAPRRRRLLPSHPRHLRADGPQVRPEEDEQGGRRRLPRARLLRAGGVTRGAARLLRADVRLLPGQAPSLHAVRLSSRGRPDGRAGGGREGGAAEAARALRLRDASRGGVRRRERSSSDERREQRLLFVLRRRPQAPQGPLRARRGLLRGMRRPRPRAPPRPRRRLPGPQAGKRLCRRERVRPARGLWVRQGAPEGLRRRRRRRRCRCSERRGRRRRRGRRGL